ncbi:hypothetical protein D3C78_912020 [compost metagenome]
MAANLVAKAGGPLHIDLVPDRKRTEVGQAQGLLHQIEADQLPLDAGDRQAAAVVGHGGAECQPLAPGRARHADHMGAKVGQLFDGHQFGGPLYYAGEHVSSPRCNKIVGRLPPATVQDKHAG